jgi:hypothetical protein
MGITRKSFAYLQAGVSASLFADAEGDAGFEDRTCTFKHVFSCKGNPGTTVCVGGQHLVSTCWCRGFGLTISHLTWDGKGITVLEQRLVSRRVWFKPTQFVFCFIST